MIDERFVILGSLANIVGCALYAYSTIHGRTKPNRVTWALWSLAPLIAFSAQLVAGVGLSALATFAAGFGPFLVFAASFVNKRSKWKLTTFDYVCGGLSMLGLVLWLITQQGAIAVALSIVADGLAATPTIIKSYRYPETENGAAQLTGALSALIALLALERFNFISAGFLVYLFMVCGLLFCLIQFKLGLKIGARRKAAVTNR